MRDGEMCYLCMYEKIFNWTAVMVGINTAMIYEREKHLILVKTNENYQENEIMQSV